MSIKLDTMPSTTCKVVPKAFASTTAAASLSAFPPKEALIELDAFNISWNNCLVFNAKPF